MKNKLLGNSVIFIGMTFIQKGMAFLLLPLYTKILSPNEYGIVSLVTSIYAIYILIFSIALDDAVARYYFKYKSDKEKKKVVLGTFTLIALATSIIGTIILVIASSLFLEPFAQKIDFFPYMILGLVPVGCSSVYSIVQKLLIIEEKAIHYSINTLVFFIMNTGLSIEFIVVMGMGAEGMLLASAITYALFFIYCIIYLFSKMSFKLDKNIAITGLKYGAILLPNRLASWGLTSLNKVVLGNFISTAALGIYYIAANFGSILTIVANSFSFALQPWIYKQLEKKEGGQNNIKILVKVVSVLFCLAGLAISLFSKEVLFLFIDNRYSDAIKIIPILVWGATTSSYGTLFVYILFYYERLTKFVSISTIFGASINIVLSLVLIPHYGIKGAAIAIAIADLLICLIKSYYSTIKANIRISFIPMHILALACLMISMVVQNVSFWIRGIIYISIFTACVVLNIDYIKEFMRMIKVGKVN